MIIHCNFTCKCFFNFQNFTTSDSFFWHTLLECISFVHWRWPFQGWNMLEWRIVLIKKWLSNILYECICRCLVWCLCNIFLQKNQFYISVANIHNCYFFKTRRMRWTGHVARKGERRYVYRVFVEKPEGNHSEDSGVDGRIILRWIIRKLFGYMDWIDLAQDKGRWRELLNAVMKLHVS